MSMKSALLVALSAVHLTTVFSTDCDHNLNQCKALAWSTCHTLAGSCTTPDYCRSEFDLCKAAENDCDSQYRQCLDNSLKRSPFITVSRSLTAYLCRLSHDQCKLAENAVGRAWSETELISSLSEAERNASSSENSTDCDSEYRQCLDNSLKRSPFITVSRSLTAYFCRLSHDQCKHAENAVGRAWSETELISSLSEAERNASSSENSTVRTTSVGEGSSSAAEIERSSSNLENFTDCENELKRCASDVWHCLPSKKTCSLNVDDCFCSYDQCKAAEVVSTTSVGEASSSAAEVERSSSNPENFTDCDSQNRQCLDNLLKRCRFITMSCSLTAYLCRLSHDQCKLAENVSTTSAGEASSSAAEIDRSSSNLENFTYCKNELNRCALDVWDHCDPLKETCSLNVDDCFRSYDQCEAAEIGNRDPANPICYE